MKRLLLTVAALLLTQAGCTVTAVSERDDPRPNNSCSSDADCRNGHCSEGLCQTLNGQIESLLVAVTPPSDSPVPHFTFVTNVEDVPTSGGEKNLALPGPSHLTGSLQLPKSISCYPTFIIDDPEHPHVMAADGVSLPVAVTLSLHQRLLGLPQQIYFSKTTEDPVKGHYGFDVQVPAGEYDVYLVPPRQQPDCPVPPQLVRSRVIEAGSFEIPFLVSPISTLNLAIHWPKSSASLKGWVADIIEPLGGNPISTAVVLGEPSDPGELSTNVEYGLTLSYSPVVEPPSSTVTQVEAHELFRLRPPPSVVAPTVVFDRSGLGLFSESEQIVYDKFTRFPAPVSVQGQMARLDDGTPASGVVSLVSTKIYGMDDGIFGAYQTTFEVGEDGLFVVPLPPGEYWVQAVPPLVGGNPPAQGALAAVTVPWLVPADVATQAGKLLELPILTEVTGQARVQGASVDVVPSPQTVLPFEKAFGGGAFSPRATSALVDDAGHFLVKADPGQFDISVRAPDMLGFGWFVRPGVQVGDKGQDLGRVLLSTPSLLTGTLAFADGSATLSSAVVRAYAYLDGDRAYTRDPKQAVSVIEVAQTRAAEDGTFRLLLPSSIAAPK